MKTLLRFTFSAVLISLTGCSMLHSPSNTAEVGEKRVEGTVPAKDNRPHVRVEFHEEGEQPKLGNLPIDVNEPLFVSMALDKVKATKRFPRFTAEVYRPGPQGYQRMAIRLEAKGRRVPAQYDYALHPNDRLIIMRDSSTALDDLTESGPLKYLQ